MSARLLGAERAIYDKAKQLTRMEADRPHALREAILAVCNGGTVAVMGGSGPVRAY